MGRPVESRDTEASESRHTIEQHADAERVILQVHPVVFRNHLFLTLLCLLSAVSGIVALIFGLTDSVLFGLRSFSLLVIGGVLVVGALIYVAFRWLQAIATTVKVTTERTITERGILSKSTNEVQHDDVRNIKSDRNISERLFNYGDIALSSSGQDDMEIVVHDIPDPQGIIKIIRSHQ